MVSKCNRCNKILTQREIIFARGLCSDCFFNSKKCSECGKPIRPYKEGYTKCRACFYNINKSNKSRIKKIENNFLNYIFIILGILFLFLIILFATHSNIFKETLNCTDGTKYNSCSLDKPLYCLNGTLINDSYKCGCPIDYKRINNSCEKIQRCIDGTEYGACSSTKPIYCSEGTLINKSTTCGCPHDYLVEGEKCILKYLTNPKKINLKGIDYIVYGGVNDYLANLSRYMWYRQGEPAPTTKDFILRDLNNEIQKEYLLPFVEKIKERTTNKKEQAQLAINIVQGIPYDWDAFETNSVSGRYPYEVLYDMKGVCMEKSDLLAFILRELGFGVIIFEFKKESHRAVGIKCNNGNYDTDHCFIESTDYYPVGKIPTNYVGGVDIRNAIPEVIIISDGESFD